MALKDLIFQKGGIGKAMTRQETIDYLNPIIHKHMAMNHRYNDAIARLADREIAADLARLQKIARVDVGKLMETVLSNGGIAYNGVDMEADHYRLDAEDDDDLLFAVLDAEQDFLDEVEYELDRNHQIRSQAILNVLQTNSRQRLDFLKENTRRRRRKKPVTRRMDG